MGTFFYGVYDEEIAQITIQDFDKHQEERMEKIAFAIRNEIIKKIDKALLKK